MTERVSEKIDEIYESITDVQAAIQTEYRLHPSVQQFLSGMCEAAWVSLMEVKERYEQHVEVGERGGI